MKTLYVCIATFVAFYIDAHPQCLDFEPPFIPNKPLRFCLAYKEYSCCTNANDQHLEEEYHNIFDKFNQANFNECSRYVRDILCTRCHPYAAHIFAAENNPQNPLHFPGLCNDYCESFFATCPEIIRHLTNDSALINARNGVDFCRLASLNDTEYCYPHIMANANLNSVTNRHSTDKEGCLCVLKVAENLRNPTFFTFSKHDAKRFYILEQIGLIHMFTDQWQILPRPFLDIQDRVYVTKNLADERGLLGLTFHPHYQNNRKFYVYYTSRNERNVTIIRISEFRASRDGLPADKDSEVNLIELAKPNNYANHNGGMHLLFWIMFGVDGYLYAFIGDGGGAGDFYNNGQNKSVLFGKAIRLEVNAKITIGNETYGIPGDNPFVHDPLAAPEAYAFGLRNAWRCSVDRGDAITQENRGRIFCGDVGQDAFEEVDIIIRGGNYGWRAKEGLACFDKALCAQLKNDTLPIFDYSHSVGKSITGGYVYRGCKSSNLKGTYIYGDYVNGKLFSLKQSNGSASWMNQELKMCDATLCTNGLQNNFDKNILSFAEDFNGEIYMLTTGRPTSDSRLGKIYKLVDPRRREDPSICKFSPSI